MKPFTPDELLPFADYEHVREAFRRRIIELKARRRLALGDKLTLVFENRDTVQFQIQEMIRVERILAPEKVREELDVYNALLPGEEELSATLFIEITDPERLKEDLDAFQGIDREGTLTLRCGTQQAVGEFEGGRSKEDKVSAVHFVRFRLPGALVDALVLGQEAPAIRVDHPACHIEVPVPAAMHREWLADLGVAAG